MLNFSWTDKMLGKLSSGQGRPSKKRIFGHVTSLIGENVITAYSECGSGGVASRIYKQGTLNNYSHF